MPHTPPMGESTRELERLASKGAWVAPLLTFIGIVAVLLAGGYGWARNHVDAVSDAPGHTVNCLACHGSGASATE